MGNGPSETTHHGSGGGGPGSAHHGSGGGGPGSAHHSYLTIRPDDISEIESTVLPQISLLRYIYTSLWRVSCILYIVYCILYVVYCILYI